MILADKIIALRKKSGWSQEELAEKLGVTRQAVSKWEGALSTPDLDRILQLSRAFGVSTDYLLKDDQEEIEYIPEEDAQARPLRRVSLAEAGEFLAVRAAAAKSIALATFLCIASPICLLLLAVAAESGLTAMGEDAAALIGLAALLLIAAPAVAIFISTGMRSSRFEYLEKEPFETEYGVTGMVRERQRQFQGIYTRRSILGVCICILSVIPLFAGMAFGEDDFACVALLCVTMLLAGAGVVLLILAGVNNAAIQKLLQEGDYSPAEKKRSRVTGAIGTAYWLVVTAGYLLWSFSTDGWRDTWIVWPVAGVLFAAVMAVCGALGRRKD